MKKISFLLAYTLAAWGAHAQVKVNNVRLQPLAKTSIEIRYDIEGVSPQDSVWFEVRSRLKRPLTPDKKYISGDVGLGITDGTNRRIVWNVIANGYELNEELQAIVHVRMANPIPPDTLPKRPGGPGFALLSAVAPGIGNIFVQTPRPRVGLRPLVTLTVAGLLVYGFNQRTQSRADYALYQEQKNIAAGDPYYTRANSAHQRYYIATRVAAAIWLTDVTLTFLRGLRNRQAERRLNIQPGIEAGKPVAVVQYRF